MYLYNFTLGRPTGIQIAVYGNFSAPKAQEIIVGRGKILELLRPDDNGRVQSVLAVEIFGVIRSIVPFRLTGGNKDFIVVGSDSGRIVILEYDPAVNRFKKVHQETFGKSGCRRIVPGQYLAADPKGRAVMIGAVEKAKLVYILNRDASARLTISSPLEAHKAHAIVFSLVGVDVGFENPIFAVLELDFEDDEDAADSSPDGHKVLTFYELDLGLNHVVRKWSDPVASTANLLVAVPGGSDGPSGVLVCSEGEISYRNQNHPPVTVAIPRRAGPAAALEPAPLIVAAATHRQKDIFFFLLQSERGDLYKVTLQYREDTVEAISVRYFDTVAVANALCVFKTGFLFVAAEFGNHAYYQFQALGDDASADEPQNAATFTPHHLRHLLLIDELESLSPILDLKVADLAKEDTPQLYAACGRGANSSLRVLRHGLAVTEMAVSPLPGNPVAVWTVRQSASDSTCKYIVVAFANATLVLAIGETVEEASDSGLLGSAPSLCVANLGDDAIVQVYPAGIRHIRADKRVHEWKTPGKKTIAHAASNERQVVVALHGGDLIYFELDALGQLLEVDKKYLGKELAALAIAPLAPGRQRSRFVAVAEQDNTVRVLSLDKDDCLQSLAVQAAPAPVESLNLAEMLNSTFLTVGLSNGILLRTVVDGVTGELSDTRTRYIGTRPVKLFRLTVAGQTGVVALSSRSWLFYNYHSRLLAAPLSYTPLDYAADFASDQCREGIVCITANTLRIITLDRLGDVFNQMRIPLMHTPRRLAVHTPSQHLVTLETDHNAASSMLRTAQPLVDPALLEAQAAERAAAQGMDVDDERPPLPDPIVTFGEPRPGPGSWASCLRLLDIANNKTLDLLELTDNEAAFSMTTVAFGGGDEHYVVVGTAQNVTLTPNRACTSAFLHVYRILDGAQFQLLHKTPVETVPGALAAFQGRLLAGIGNTLRIYDLGKKKLLRKCEHKNFPNLIVTLTAHGDRIIVGDVQESVHVCKYQPTDNSIFVFADETTPRWLTATTQLDYDTVAGADKFGNVFVSRLPPGLSDDIADDPTGNMITQSSWLQGAAYKLDDVNNFHVGDTVTSLVKAQLVPAGAEALIYATVLGSIGALVPFVSREDVDFFSHLEMHLRQEAAPLCGRDHLHYRSYYWPVKDVIDGDLCEQFSSLDVEKQRSIAEELDRTPMEVVKKLEDFRNRLL
eukprot:TRINITY_DN7109_c0_g1_i1.p1 TRINITY_DN7109_c0_g1~~TRINITY_DN7109_c0_g1_i1.p1  ORF type:complete len:1188 (+),score=598.46 TRINITY_DN7109_c0_g1_i1:160-3723(+)